MRAGIVSDTHGLLRPEVLSILREGSVEHILHAGDVGNITILDQLRTVAPVTAIRGNIDIKGPCADLPATEAVELSGQLIYLVHSLEDLDIDPVAAGIRMVVSGHSHRPALERRDDVLYLNPGSCGPRRFRPMTLALAEISPGGIEARMVEIPV